MVGVAVQCDRTQKPTVVKGTVKAMEEPSFCNLSLAVDCTLSLGSTTARTDIPSRLSRAGSSDQEFPWSLSVPSERGDPSRGQELSWGGSCSRSDLDLSPEYYPQVLEKGSRSGDGGRKAFKAWPRSCAQSYKDEVNTSSAHFGTIDDQAYSTRTIRQPWVPGHVPSSAATKVEQCMEDGDSFVRVCAHCGTSKTPLWRNGPGGPKSLCNACGIRFKKAGRRSAANGTPEAQLSPPAPTKAAKRRPMSDEPQYWLFPADAKPRKRSRGSLPHRASESILSGSCMTWQPWSSPKSSLHRGFLAAPPSPSEDRKVPALDCGSFSSDEEEGAVLLMALSCGMVNL